jgi:hypothetical protein
MIKCRDHYIGQSIIKPGLTGILVNESQRHLYFINEDEYVEFNFCPNCGKDLVEKKK